MTAQPNPLWTRFASGEAGAAILNFSGDKPVGSHPVPEFEVMKAGSRLAEMHPETTGSEFFRAAFSAEACNNLVVTGLTTGTLEIECPFTRRVMKCSQSHYERGRNYLFFTGGDGLCILVQSHSQIIGAAFPRRRLIIGQTSRSLPAKRIEQFLGSYLPRITGFAPPTAMPVFRGAIASYWRPNHYFYDVMPSLHALGDTLGDRCGTLRLVSMEDSAFLDLGDHFSGRFPTLSFADADALNASNQEQGGFMIAVGSRTKEDRLAADRVDADIVTRSIAQTRNGPLADAFRQVQAHPMTLWVGLCAEKRGWEGQEEGIALVAEQLRRSRGAVALIADGMTRTTDQDREAFRQTSCAAEIAVLERLKARLPDVEIFDLIGAGAAEKVAFGSACGLFLAGGMTDSMWPAKLGARPGIAHTSTVADISSQSHPRTRHFPKSKVRDLPGREASNFTLVSYRIKPEAMSRFVRREITPLLPGLLSEPAVRVLSGPEGAVRHAPGRIFVDLEMDAVLELEVLESPRGAPLSSPVGPDGSCRAAVRGVMDAGIRARIGFVFNDDTDQSPVMWRDCAEVTDVRGPAGTASVTMRIQISGQGRASIHEAFLIPASGSS